MLKNSEVNKILSNATRRKKKFLKQKHILNVKFSDTQAGKFKDIVVILLKDGSQTPLILQQVRHDREGNNGIYRKKSANNGNGFCPMLV